MQTVSRWIVLAFSLAIFMVASSKASKEETYFTEYGEKEHGDNCDDVQKSLQICQSDNKKCRDEVNNAKKDDPWAGFTRVSSKAFARAKMPFCQFLVLAKQGELAANQGPNDQNQRVKACVDKENCVGFYLEPKTNEWHLIFKLNPKGRHFYEEKCNEDSALAPVHLYLHKTRFQGTFACNREVFSKEGLDGTNTVYHVRMNKMNRNDALATCEQLGAKLVEVESAEELTKVLSLWDTEDWSHTGAQREFGSDGRLRAAYYWRYSRLAAHQDWLWSGPQPDNSGMVGQLFHPKGAKSNMLDDYVEAQNNIVICECQDPIVDFLD